MSRIGRVSRWRRIVAAVAVPLIVLGLQALLPSPALADPAEVTVVAPKEGATLPGPDVSVELASKNLAITDQGTKEDPNEGHFHITLDKRPFIAVYGSKVTFNGLPAGDHEVKIEPVLSTHMMPIPGTRPLTVKFKTTAAPPPAAPAPSGAPKITVMGPAAGATLSGDSVTLRVAAENFRLTNQGLQPSARNEGHMHITLDSRPFLAWTDDTLVFRNVPAGQHNIRVEPVTNGHDPVAELPAINVRFSMAAGAQPAQLPRTGSPGLPLEVAAFAGLALLGAGLAVARVGRGAR